MSRGGWAGRWTPYVRVLHSPRRVPNGLHGARARRPPHSSSTSISTPDDAPPSRRLRPPAGRSRPAVVAGGRGKYSALSQALPQVGHVSALHVFQQRGSFLTLVLPPLRAIHGLRRLRHRVHHNAHTHTHTHTRDTIWYHCNMYFYVFYVCISPP